MARQDQFLYYLQHARGGELQDNLSEAMDRALAATRETGKASTVKFTIKLAAKGNQVLFSEVIDTKLPEPETAPSIMFVDDDGSLTRRNPNQGSLDLRHAPDDDAGREPRSV